MKKRTKLQAAILAAWALMPSASIAIEDCGTSVTECRMKQDIKNLQQQIDTLLGQVKKQQATINTQQKRIAELEKNSSYTLVINGQSCSNQEWYAEVETLVGNVFLDIRANFTHCGGGCHWAFRHLKVLFNSYTAQLILTDTNNNSNGHSAGEWTITRLITETSKYGDHSGKMRIEKSSGNLPYCGPVDIRIESNAPLRLLKTS